MITIHYVGPAPADTDTAVQCETGRSLMEVAVSNRVEGIEADCGGMMTCATCHVYVREPHAAQLPPPTAEELSMLEFTAAPRKPNSRLSCQIRLTEALDGLTVELPETQH